MGILYTKQAPRKSRNSIPTTLYSEGKLARELVNPRIQASTAANIILQASTQVTGGEIDVVKDFPWTLTTSLCARAETPFILLDEYYMVDSSLNQQIKAYGITDTGVSTKTQSGLSISANDLINLTKITFNEDTKKLYEGLYDHTNYTGFSYKLPLFSQEQFSLSNAWEKKDILNTVLSFQQQGIGAIKRGGAAIARALLKGKDKDLKDQTSSKGSFDSAQIPEILKTMAMFQYRAMNPVVGLLDPPQIFRTTAPREYSIKFYLYNTIETDDKAAETAILKNWELCYLLTYQNLVNKRNFFTALPPVFYSVFIPGIHYCKASYMKNLTITHVGNVRVLRLKIDDGPETDVNIPDAYQIDITMQDLLMPSKNLKHAAITNPEFIGEMTLEMYNQANGITDNKK